MEQNKILVIVGAKVPLAYKNFLLEMAAQRGQSMSDLIRSFLPEMPKVTAKETEPVTKARQLVEKKPVNTTYGIQQNQQYPFQLGLPDYQQMYRQMQMINIVVYVGVILFSSGKN